MFFQLRPAEHATPPYFFGRAGHGMAIAVDGASGDEDWFIAEANSACCSMPSIPRGEFVAALIADLSPQPLEMARIVEANLHGGSGQMARA